jgi:hypothetical protein
VDARNRTIPDWWTRIKNGQLLLPRFQRDQAWSYTEVGALLEAVLRNLPSGAVLVLEIGATEPFKSRPVISAPEPTERCNEHLLDGQQRLTALWRSLSDGYEDRTWLIGTEFDEEHHLERFVAVGQSRWTKGNVRYPVWIDSPKEVWRRGYIPARLLRPVDLGDEAKEWALAATDGDISESWHIDSRINDLRTKVATYNVPYLSLPSSTPPDVALDVFIKLNSTAVPLTAFDIVVAQVEAAASISLPELVDSLTTRAPAASAYRDVGTWVLDTGSLREERTPAQASYYRLNYVALVEDWDTLAEGVACTTEFLTEEHVFDQQRLPSVAVLPIIAALHEHLPTQPDRLGNARRILRAFLWRAFLTNRYERSGGSRSLQDFLGLKKAISEDLPVTALGPIVPIFDEEQHPLPTLEALMQARWPTYRDTLARGILAVSLRAGARDLADDVPATRGSINGREYHHLFPDALLTSEPAELPTSHSYRALNCALITWRTNRTISAKKPVKYLQERIDRGQLSDGEIQDRLATHLVPFEELNVGWIEDDPGRGAQIRSDYDRFLIARGKLVLDAITKLCDGQALEMGRGLRS